MIQNLNSKNGSCFAFTIVDFSLVHVGFNGLQLSCNSSTKDGRTKNKRSGYTATSAVLCYSVSLMFMQS